MKLYAKFVRFLGYDENQKEVHLKCNYLGEEKDWSKIWVLEDYQTGLCTNIAHAFRQKDETALDCARRLKLHPQIKYCAIFDSKIFDEQIELMGHSLMPDFIEPVRRAINGRVCNEENKE